MTVRQPRLLVLSSTYPRWAGDPEPGFVHELTRRLAEDFEVLVITPGAPGALDEEILDGVRVRRYRYAPKKLETLVHHGGILTNLRRSPWKLLLVPFFVISQWVFVRRALKNWRPHVLHAHWLIPQGWIAHVAAGSQVPYVLTSHGADLFALRSPLFCWMRRWAVTGAAAVSVVSEAMSGKLREESPEARVQVMPMGVDVERRFVPNQFVSREAAELLFVGRLVEKKGLRHLLEALPAISAARTDVHLTIAGFGPEHRLLERRVEELGLQNRVRFLGPVPQDRLPELYQRATLLVAPFVAATGGDQEGLGLVIAEAMACGCPVLAGDVPGVRDLVRPDTGVIVDAADHSAMAASVVSLLNDEARRKQLAEGGRKLVMQGYAWPVVADRYHSLLRTVVAEARCPRR